MQVKTADFNFTTETPPGHYRYSYEQNLYGLNSYLKCQPEMPGISFWICDHDKFQVHCEIHFHFYEKKATSQSYAPFGSFHGCYLLGTVMFDFLSFIIETLTHLGLSSLELLSPPLFYNTDPKWLDLLKDFGFAERNGLNHHLVIDDAPLVNKMHKMEQRKLRRSDQFSFRIHPYTNLEKIYQFVLACRRERDQHLSMSYESLKRVVFSLPENFLLCTVELGHVLAAVSIVIKVNSSCWYQFYPGHSKQFDSESPLVFLINQLYKHAIKQNIKVIDLGSSEIEGHPIEGLQKFKSRIGGIATSRSWACTSGSVARRLCSAIDRRPSRFWRSASRQTESAQRN